MKFKTLLLSIFLTFLAVGLNSYEDIWQEILDNHTWQGTKNGIELVLFDYEGVLTEPRFEQLIQEIELFDLESLSSREDQLAFWINVYNIAAVKLILENYPVKGIKTIGSLFKPVWRKKAIIVDGESYTLEKIEHGILRELSEPRIHFAIVCASVSCPDLALSVYTPEDLDRQLNEQTLKFLKNRQKGLRIDRTEQVVRLSSIFKWFMEDFGAEDGIRDFIFEQTGENINDLKIRWMSYDWDLNWKQRK